LRHPITPLPPLRGSGAPAAYAALTAGPVGGDMLAPGVAAVCPGIPLPASGPPPRFIRSNTLIGLHDNTPVPKVCISEPVASNGA
jgi:hypothetical protein